MPPARSPRRAGARRADASSSAAGRRRGEAGRVVLAAALLVAAVVAAFSPVRSHRFVSFDDPMYVTENPEVREGLGAPGLRYAFRGSHGGNWHPLTTLSHMLDAELFGTRPEAASRHVATSVALHAANGVLVLLLLRAATGSLLLAALGAALFALHPLRVESVAWVSSRKDVLSGLFGLLAALAWLRYGRRPSPGGYAVAAIAFALGLMAKPILVVLPVLFLLLDAWPLGRLATLRDLAARVREKLPLLALSALSTAVTVAMQQEAGAVGSLRHVSLAWRLANAPVAVAQYLGATLWPRGLAPFYPHPAHAPGASLAEFLPAVLGAAFLLLVLTGLAAAAWRTRPWWIVGWLWFLVALAPVIGLVQVGSQARADRYTYLPHVGLVLALAGAGAAVARRRPQALPAIAAVGLAAAGALAVATARQTGHWRDSERLYTHALAVTRDNHLAHANLGSVYLREGRLDAARAHYTEALRLQPGDPLALAHLAAAELARGDLAAAAPLLERALRLDPDAPEALANLALLRAEQGDLAAAEGALRRALAPRPDDPDLHRNLARVLYRQGRPAEAARALEAALERGAADAADWRDLGLARLAAGEGAAAERALRRALALAPDDPETLNTLAWVLATAADPVRRDGAEAVRLAERALALRGAADAGLLDTLAAAHAARGDFARARQVQARALALAPPEAREPLRERLALYRAGRPYVEGSADVAPSASTP